MSKAAGGVDARSPVHGKEETGSGSDEKIGAPTWLKQKTHPAKRSLDDKDYEDLDDLSDVSDNSDIFDVDVLEP